MNLVRISELNNLINSLNTTLSKLKERKRNLEVEVYNAKNVQERIDYAVNVAKNRVSELSTLGLKAEFLEEILRPIQNAPDCSGMGNIVDSEISGLQGQIEKANDEIWWASEEKKKLEMEDDI